MNIPDIIPDLKSSPLFNLSLSSKELFHSNFIAWICEAYPIEFGEILIKKFNLKNENIEFGIKNVQRERKNIDLTIEFEFDRLIIENKVKSIPDKEQLKRYRDKSNDNDTFVLLTLIPPNFTSTQLGWHVISYKDIISIFNDLSKNISEENIYHKNIIKDYTFFIKTLINITESLSFDIKNEFYDYYGEDYEIFRKIRLHDLYIKYKYNQIVSEIHSFLSSKLENVKISKGVRYSHEIHKGQLVISFNLVNGKGVVNIDFSNENETIYGIMLDGNRYNHYMYTWGETNKIRYEIGDTLRSNNKWFTFDFISEHESYPKKGKNFNKFKDMIYRSAKIQSKTSMIDLLEIIYRDTIKMMKISTNANKIYNK